MLITQTVENYLFARKSLAPTTRTWYRDKLRLFVAWCEEQGIIEIDQVKPFEIRCYQEYRSSCTNPQTGKLLSGYSLRSDAVVIKTFLKFCHEEEIISSDPGKRIEVPKIESKVIEIFTVGQIKAMLAACQKEKFPALAQRNKTIISVLLDTGIRASELCGLTLEHCYLNSSDPYIRVRGKGRKEREVGLGKQSRKALHSYITQYRKSSRPEVFISHTGEPLTRKGLDSMLSSLCETAHIKGVRCSAHTFRHTYACTYLLSGGDIYKLSILLGHTSVQVTEIYLRAIRAKEARQGGLSVLDNIEKQKGH